VLSRLILEQHCSDWLAILKLLDIKTSRLLLARLQISLFNFLYSSTPIPALKIHKQVELSML
jgi:hypothetical protein